MEPIAVIGIGCRFPQAKDPQAFWQLLVNGKEAISSIPQDRWQVPAFYDSDLETPGKMNVRRGGFLDEVDRFDADFFGMSAEEVEHTDPQQRLFLEVAWEALENAGIEPASLAKSQTGVFSGLCTVDYHRLLYKNYERIGAYSGTGTTMCITANRLSYLLDLQGPSIAIDAACSSSLVTVHLACQSLRCQESDLCLAGGVNLILSPDSTISSTKTKLLSPEGRCKSFDADADGYARGEGCGIVVLKRLSDALKDRDHILALIKGSAVNHNGLSNSLSAPNGLAQQTVIRQALKNAGVQPADISYIDAHAVGTGIGDAIEFKALQAVLGEDRQPDQRCGVGSVKTNIGHLEAAAGISALIKVILALQHEAIPPHLHLQKLNPYISLNDSFYIPTHLQQWSRGETNRLAGVSAFGFGGTNAHVILEEAPLATKQPATLSRPLHLITLSAKSEPALRQLTQDYQSLLESQPQIDIANLGFTANTGRNHFKHRLCLIAKSTTQMHQQLTAFINRHPAEGLLTGLVKGRKRPKITWFFPGKSCNYHAAAMLYQTQPSFRQGVANCDQILRPYLTQPLLADLSPSAMISGGNMAIAHGWETQPCLATLFAIEYGLAQLWASWGIKPKTVMGHGVGELVAATVAGVLELEVALKLLALEPSITSWDIAEISNTRSKILLTSLRPEVTNEEMTTRQYWCGHWQQAEKYVAPLTTVGDDQLLSMGVRPTLAANDESSLFSMGCNLEASWQEILNSLSKLYLQGIAIDWSGFDSDYHRCPLALPTYPFQRQRYWFAPSAWDNTVTKPIPQLL